MDPQVSSGRVASKRSAKSLGDLLADISEQATAMVIQTSAMIEEKTARGDELRRRMAPDLAELEGIVAELRDLTTALHRQNWVGRAVSMEQEALALINESPEVTLRIMAERMGMEQCYLTPVLSGLAERGVVVKKGRGWLLATLS